MILDAHGRPVEVEPIAAAPERDRFAENWAGVQWSGYLLRRAEANARAGLPLDHWVQVVW